MGFLGSNKMIISKGQSFDATREFNFNMKTWILLNNHSFLLSLSLPNNSRSCQVRSHQVLLDCHQPLSTLMVTQLPPFYLISWFPYPIHHTFPHPFPDITCPYLTSSASPLVPLIIGWTIKKLLLFLNHTFFDQVRYSKRHCVSS